MPAAKPQAPPKPKTERIADLSRDLFDTPKCTAVNLSNVGYLRDSKRKREDMLDVDDHVVYVNTPKYPQKELVVDTEKYIPEYIHHFLLHTKDMLKYADLEHIRVPWVSRGRQETFIRKIDEILAE